MKTYTLLALLSISLLFSCSDDENEKTYTKSTYLITDDYINIPLNSIDSLDIRTGRLSLVTNISPDSISDIEFGERKFMINGKFYFNLYYTNSLNSSMVNDPVIFYNFEDGKLYIQNGYPPLDSIKNDFQKIKGIREKNWESIDAEWNSFVTLLRENDVTVIDPEITWEEEFPNSGDSIVIYRENIKSFDKETGKIVLYEKIPVEVIRNLKWEIYKFCVDSIPFFDVHFTTTGNSRIINVPVLMYDIHDENFYLIDGYPAAKYLGKGQELAQKIRDKHMKLIEEERTAFLEYIKK